MDLYATPEKSSFLDSQSQLSSSTTEGMNTRREMELEDEEDNDDDQVTTDLVSGLMMVSEDRPVEQTLYLLHSCVTLISAQA